MKRKNINGILIGSFIGGLLGLFAKGNIKPQRKRFIGTTKDISNKASNVVNNMTKEVTKLIKNK